MLKKGLKYSSGLLSSQREENCINLTSFSFGLLPNMNGHNPLEDLSLPLPPLPITLKIMFSLDWCFSKNRAKIWLQADFVFLPCKTLLEKKKKIKDPVKALKLEKGKLQRIQIFSLVFPYAWEQSFMKITKLKNKGLMICRFFLSWLYTLSSVELGGSKE